MLLIGMLFCGVNLKQRFVRSEVSQKQRLQALVALVPG